MNNPMTQTIKVIIASLMLTTIAPLMAQEIDLSGRTEQDTSRDANRKPAQMINYVGVKPGDSVLDLLAGSGYYSEILSRAVGENGSVVLQIPKAYLKYVEKPLEQRLAGDRLKNVTYLLSEAEDVKLGSDKFDSAFLVLGYHDMFNKSDSWNFTADAVMPQVLKALKPGGKLLIIDHNTAPGHGIDETNTLHRIEADFVKADLEKRGFRFLSSSDKLANKSDDHTKGVFDKAIRGKTDRFVLLFEKPAK